MEDRGIVYLDMGLRHQVVAAVSIFTLRRYWSGPITIFHDEVAAPIVQRIAADGKAEARLFDPVRYRRNSHYAAKPALPAMSPYQNTIQIDTDTIWRGPPDDLFAMLTPTLTIVTQFGCWVTTGPKMRGRIEVWRKADPERVERSLAKPWPALNTGTIAYGNEAVVAREAWARQIAKLPDVFMSDEIGFICLVPDYADRPDLLLITDDRFNASPRFGKHKDDATVLHFHGCGKLDRLPEYRRAWEPEFRQVWQCNFAGIQSWARDGAKGWIETYLDKSSDMVE